MKIVITDSKSNFPQDCLKDLSKYEVRFYEKETLDVEEIHELYSEEEVILGLDELKFNEGYADLNHAIPKLKNVAHIVGLSSRYNLLDTSSLRKHGIGYSNNPNTTTQAVAELGVMMMLMLLRCYSVVKNKNYQWFSREVLGNETTGKRVGIIGLGNIGTVFASICQSLGMQVAYWNRVKKDVELKYLNFDEVLTSDIVFIGLVTNTETKRIMAGFESKLGANSILIDVIASDDLYNKNKIIALANEGKIQGFGFEKENSASKYLESNGNVVSTPHIGWATEEADYRLYRQWTDEIIRVAEKCPQFQVN